MMPPPPEVAVIIPVYNRPELLRYSLESLRGALAGISAEVIIVDDGSEQPPNSVAADFPDLPLVLIRTPNAGSIPARATGFRASRAPLIQFLDSDDMIAPEKLRAQMAQIESARADLVYCDAASVTLNGPYAQLRPVPNEPFAAAANLAEFCFRAQPNPHAPLYRRELIERALINPVVPADRRFDPVGDAWLYYNIAVLDGTVAKLDRPWAIVGAHPEPRYTRHWEVLGVAAWHMMVAFDQNCPRTAATESARGLFGETCFAMWRALPLGFDAGVEESLVSMWRRTSPAANTRLGGRGFRAAASVLGTERAARLLRRLQRPPYRKIATLSPDRLHALLRAGREPGPRA